jgi:hypothetical protein
MESVEDVEFASLRGPLLSGRHAAVARGLMDSFPPREACIISSCLDLERYELQCTGTLL